MKCFTHPQTDAVAQCSQCQKGTCTDCAHHIDGGTLCSSCYETGLRGEIVRAQRSIVAVWVFTGIVTAISVIAAFGSISQVGIGAILYIPLAFAASWCLFWGWPSVWNWFRRQGFWVAGSWFVLLIVIGLAFEVLIMVAVVIGAFTGIKKYREAKWIIANANRLLTGLPDIPAQQMVGTQGGGTA
jgi:hypothetical protein